MSRFVVTSLDGNLGYETHREGTSFHVLDVPYNRRLVATYRSEDYKYLGRTKMRDEAGRQANAHAARLNAL